MTGTQKSLNSEPRRLFKRSIFTANPSNPSRRRRWLRFASGSENLEITVSYTVGSLQKKLNTPQNDMNLVFTDALGGHYAHATIYHTFKRIVSAIDLPDRRFHDLRHTYAVLAIQSGVDIKTVQENLGHHTAAFTLDQYGHVTQRMQNEAAARMEAMIVAHKGKKPF